MSLFVKHVADKQQFHVTIPCFSLTLRRLPKQSRSRHFGGVSEKKKLARTTWHQRGIMRPTNKATADSRSVQSFTIIKNTGHRNCFTLGRFHTRARNGLSISDLPVYSHPLHHRHSFSLPPSEGRGWLYTGYLKWIIHLQLNCQTKLTKKARRIVLIQN